MFSLKNRVDVFIGNNSVAGRGVRTRFEVCWHVFLGCYLRHFSAAGGYSSIWAHMPHAGDDAAIALTGIMTPEGFLADIKATFLQIATIGQGWNPRAPLHASIIPQSKIRHSRRTKIFRPLGKFCAKIFLMDLADHMRIARMQ